MSKQLAVEYADTCNFIVGCTGCELSSRGQNICWADKMFNRGKAMNPQTWIHNRQFIGDVQFYRERLQKLDCKIPRFYLNGMGDPFCPDSPLIRDIPNWLEVLSAENEKHLSQTEIYWWHIIQALLNNPQSHLILLTKWPENIPTDLPDLPNLWVGASSGGSHYQRIKTLCDHPYGRKVISLEPYTGSLSDGSCENAIYMLRNKMYRRKVQGIIIGGYSRKRIELGSDKCIQYILRHAKTCNIPVYVKSNISKYYPEFAGIKEFPKIEC